MGVNDVGRLSLGEWTAICRAWNRAHGGAKAEAPSDDEFEAAVLAARGVG
jgi:hypothetical protein